MKTGRKSPPCSSLVWLCILWSGIAVPHVQGDSFSVFTACPDDPQAVYLTPDRFAVAGDGVADDAPALQQAIDQVAARGSSGVLFVPPGTYRLSRTVYVWPGVRLIGCGLNRPVFLLGENTPGFQEGEGRYMLFFSGGRGRAEGDPPRDGNPGTFYSALSNIDIEIREGNPAAIGIRFHIAQHCFLEHMEFRLGSARAGVQDIGNHLEDLHFRGGQYGILTGRSAPGWPAMVLDCSFEDQRVAGIGCAEAGLAVVRPRFRNLPVAVALAPDEADQLWVSDAVIENVAESAFVIGRERSARTQINLENVSCERVPTLVRFHESGRVIRRSESAYVVDRFSHGLHLGQPGADRKIKTSLSVRRSKDSPPAVPSDVPRLPPCESWVNVKTLGAAGDGQTDDTRALREAIARHRTLYLPLGLYRVTDTLRLRPDTVLVGFHPAATVIYLPDESDAFQDPAAPRALIEAPFGGSNIVSGLGVYTRPLNPSAIAVRWTAGERSLMNDVRLHGGHGTRLPGGIEDNWGRAQRDRWDSQPPSLWVTDGGGGVFKNIWTPSPYARAGILISDTATRGRVYAMSVEHHVSHEMIIRNASNWRFHALQFEEEREEGPKALPLLIENSSDLQLANTFFYRVISSSVPAPEAIRVQTSQGIRLRNTRVYSNSKVSFDNAVLDADSGLAVRDSEFAVLDLPVRTSTASQASRSRVVARGSGVRKLADGFRNISGAALDPKGQVYFVDPPDRKVYRWLDAEDRIEMVRAIAEQPEQLAFDRSGNLLMVAREGDGTVLSWNPNEPATEPRRLEAQPAKARPGLVPILPVNRWMGARQFISDSTQPRPYHYVSPDGSVFLPAGADFTTGARSWGVKHSDLLRAFRLAPAEAGKRFHVSNEAELETWSFQVGSDGTLSDPRLFVEEGGEGVAVDHRGRVYLAAGQVRVFDPRGRPVGVIEVPQRPTGLVFGGEDRKTLFITARSALYCVKVR